MYTQSPLWGRTIGAANPCSTRSESIPQGSRQGQSASGEQGFVRSRVDGARTQSERRPVRTAFFLLRLLGSVLGAPILRLIRGRRRTSWSLREEVVWTGVRCLIHSASRNGIAWMRKMEKTASPPSPLFRHVSFLPVKLGGVEGLQCGSAEETAERSRGGPPVILYFHGGAYVVGSAWSYREISARLALDCAARVVTPDYRLGPEHPFPAAHDDCLAVYRALLEQGVDPQRMALAGDSAGGALALATLVTARDEGLELPAAAVLFSPWADPSASEGSMRTNLEDDVLDGEFLELGIDGYLQPRWLDDPRVRLTGADLSGLPPLLLQVGDAEIFLDQVRELAERASSAGTEVTLKVYEDLFHTFQSFTTVLPRAEAAVGDSTAFLAGLWND